MKTAIALRGIANSGKTSTLRLVYAALRERYPNCRADHLKDFADVRAVLTTRGVRVGIESQGDPAPRLPASLKLFVGLDCQVIVCTTRSHGNTVMAVGALASSGYEVVWFEKAKESDLSKRTAANQFMADTILAGIERAIDAAADKERGAA